MAKKTDTNHVTVTDATIVLRHLYDALPETAKTLIEILGVEGAAVVIDKFGGMSIPIPRVRNCVGERRYDHLAEELGMGVANRLVKHFGGEDGLYIPQCKIALLKLREARIRQEFDALTRSGPDAHSAREAANLLAQKYQMCDRSVWRILKRVDEVVIPSVYRDGELF